MITIYCDFQKIKQILSDAYTRSANQVQDYIPLRQYLRRALNDRDHDYTVYIQNRIIAEWLRDLRDYPSTLVYWAEIDSHEKFRSTDNLSAVSDVSSAPIEAANGPIQAEAVLSSVQAEQNKVVPPTVTIKGSLLSNQATTLHLTLINPNPFSLYAIHLSATDLHAMVEWQKLEANSQVTHEFIAPPTRRKGEVQSVEYVCTCEAIDRVWQFNDYVEIPIRRLQRNEVDALFEDMS